MSVLKTYSISEDFPNGLCTVSLEEEIKDSGSVRDYAGLSVRGDQVEIIGGTLDDPGGLATVIVNHTDLWKRRRDRIQQIKKRDRQLIDSGFTFDSVNFALDDKTRSDWLGLKTLEALLSWPVDITTKEDGAYSLTQANLNSFLGLGLGTYQGVLSSGRALKLAIKAATTQAELDAVVDNR